MTAAKARYVMVGGFLGAGKTTSILRLAEWLVGRLPDRSLHPVNELDEIFHQLSGGRIRISRIDELPVPEIGWATGVAMRRANGWLAQSTAVESSPAREIQRETSSLVSEASFSRVVASASVVS